MQFRLYLLDISKLEDVNLQQRAFAFIDFFRKNKVYKYKNEKDRMRQIATGLLLQIGLLEIEKPFEQNVLLQTDCGTVHLLDVISTIKVLEEQNAGVNIGLPVEAVYEENSHGKPYWSQEFIENLSFEKKMQYFNISHSGQYAALAIADTEIGLDIQEPRATKHIKGDYRSFSRMEAYVKCTGEGIFEGYSKYEEQSNILSEYGFLEIDIIPNYGVNLCYKL